MEVQVTALSRRGSALMRRTWRVSARRVRLGRGTGNEIPLSDIRVDLTAAAMFPLGGGVTIEALGPSPMRVNGVAAKAAAIRPGDEIGIGPYSIKVGQPTPGIDVDLTIELSQPLGDSLDRLMSHCRIGLEQTGLNKRRTAWIGFIVILLIAMIAPMAVYLSGGRALLANSFAGINPITIVSLFWKPGELSNSHRFFAAECTTCHERPFIRVADKACLSCHQNVGSHVAPGLQLGGMQDVLEASRCTDCHEEHRGIRSIIVSEARLCVNCHGTIAETTPTADVRNVTGFPNGHPQFRVTVVSDPAQAKKERILVDASPAPVDKPGIKFSHAAHLVPNGFPVLGIKALDCAHCHVSEPSGQGFQPVTYKKQCADCHALDFDKQELPWPNARVPHGDDVGIEAAVWNFYAGKALQGGLTDQSDLLPARRVPGAPLRSAADSSAMSPQQWVAQKTEATLRTIVFDKNRGCAYCHYGTGPNGDFQMPELGKMENGPPTPPSGHLVAPVSLQSRFLPHAEFDHAKHSAVACDQCHDARSAEQVGQMLIPGIANCAQCHGAEKAALHAQSTCTSCHGFHNKSLGPMRPVTAAAN